MVHGYGPQCFDTTAVAEQESAAGQWFLIGDPSLGWIPSSPATAQTTPQILICAAVPSSRTRSLCERPPVIQAWPKLFSRDLLLRAARPIKIRRPGLRAATTT